MKRLGFTIAAALYPVALFWLGGFDFDTRGLAAVYMTLCSTIVAAAVYIFPEWEEHK